MNTCCINRLREVTCATVNGKAVWFKCRYANCHGGIGHVVITTTDGKKIYDGCPTQASSKYVYIDFDATWLNTLGGIMDVTYKPGDCNWGSHVCNRATFDWGFASDEQTVVGTAYLDNLGGSNDLGNSCGLGGSARCSSFTIAAGSLSAQTSTSPTGFYAKTRRVCFVGANTCEVVINVSGSGATPPNTALGTLERFRLVADGIEVWSFGPTAPGHNLSDYPNWLGDTEAIEPSPIAPAIIQLPKGTNNVEFFVHENANGFPVAPGPIYPPFSSKTAGSSWHYDVTFPDGQRFVSKNTASFKYSPLSGDPYWATQGKTGIEARVFSWTRKS